MKIRLVRTGGIAGLRMTTELDTDSLPPAESRQIEELASFADGFTMPEESPSAAGGADRFQYRLEVTTAAGSTHSVVMAEDSVPEKARPLLERLLAAARYGR